jgi:hypothetical protein
MPRTHCDDPRLALLDLCVRHVRAEMWAGRFHRIHLLARQVGPGRGLDSRSIAESSIGSARETEEYELVVDTFG